MIIDFQTPPPLSRSSGVDPGFMESGFICIKVQQRAARFVTGDYRYTTSVTAMTESLSWESLQHRRQQAKAIMMFRIVHAMVAIPAYPKPPAFRGCYKRSPVQVQSPIMQDQYIQGFLLPVKYPTVEPAARETDKR